MKGDVTYTCPTCGRSTSQRKNIKVYCSGIGNVSTHGTLMKATKEKK